MLHYDPQLVSSNVEDRSVTYILLKNKGIVH